MAMDVAVDFSLALENQEQYLGYFVLILKREHWIRLGATHTVSLSEVREEARNCRKLLREKTVEENKVITETPLIVPDGFIVPQTLPAPNWTLCRIS